jgi:N-acylneuraminate cytidylyltransferase
VSERKEATGRGVLGIVPARAGSKGVPGKNIRLLHGHPLLEYTARAARESGALDRVVLTTDSPEIAEVGRRVGFEVPFLRPAALSADDTPMLPVLQHVLSSLAVDGWAPRLVVLLQPTSPLRRPAHIVRAVTMLEESEATSVVSVVELPRHLSPDYVMRIEDGVLRPFLADGLRITRRQDARPAYVRDGTVYAFRPETLERFGDIYGDDCRPLLIPADESLSIDSPADWDAAERMLARAE